MDKSLIKVWERGCAQAPHERAVLLAEHLAAPGREARDLPIAERDRLLWQCLRDAIGRSVPCYVACPSCGEELEFTLDVESLLQDRSPEPAEARVAVGAFEVVVRPPTSRDLDCAMDAGDGGVVRALLQRIVVSAREKGEAVAAEELPDDVLDGMDRFLSEGEFGLHPVLETACSKCDHAWNPVIDVVALLWAHVERHARWLLDDVHCLASAYGWSEDQILSLSRARRDEYLARCRA